MTSRVSFLKLLFETLRRHMAAVLITVLVFVIHIITFFLNIQNILNTVYIEEIVSSSYPKAEYIENAIEEITELAAPNFGNGVIAMLIGAYLAFDFLRYMHSKRETDFYDSMPIRRQTWFKTLFLSGFGVFFVLCALTTTIETAIIFGLGYGSLTILQNMLWNLICMIAAFLVTWVTTALAMVMTGHSIVAFLGFGVFASYVPLILANLIPTYASQFFETYVYSDINPNAYYFSPATLVYKMTQSWNLLGWQISEHWTYIIGCFVFTIIIGIITYLLFLRRPSEAAGRAMAYEKANSVIRFMLVIPLSLYVGLFLSEMASMASTAWLIFGVIFATCLIHGIMECIFQFDIRALVSKKKQLLISILLSLAFVFVFWADFMKYDEYVPNADDVKTVKITSNLIDSKGREWETERDWLQGEYVKDAIIAAKDIINLEKPSEDEYYYMDYITFTYTMKNGREIERAYSYNASIAPESLSKLYANEEFKDDICVLYSVDRSKIDSLRVNNGMKTMSLNLTDEEMNQFIDIYLEEYTAFELPQLFTDYATYELIVDYQNKNYGYSTSESYYVYPSFTKTLSFLQEKGIVNFFESENVKITSMEIFDGKYVEADNRFINDAELLNELKQYMLINQFMYRGYTDEYVYAEIKVEVNGETNYTSVCIKQSDIDKILED